MSLCVMRRASLVMMKQCVLYSHSLGSAYILSQCTTHFRVRMERMESSKEGFAMQEVCFFFQLRQEWGEAG